MTAKGMKSLELVLLILVAAWFAVVVGCGPFDQWVVDNTKPPVQAPTTQPTTPPTNEERGDEFIGNTIQTIGTVIGAPILAAAGLLYGRMKPRKRIRDLVETFQAGREDMKAEGNDAALARLDQVVGEKQKAIKGMEDFVRSVKKKANIQSVNGPQPRS
ncbi:MAG: hypothetical protein ABIH03_04320 [Pseudomonadota bacterium]